MFKRSEISPEIVRLLLDYCPETGELTWRKRSPCLYLSTKLDPLVGVRSFNRQFAGKPAFTTIDKKGYKVGGILNYTFKAHRVAWAIAYGQWPRKQIDHINRNPSDNRLANLRDCSPLKNNVNKGAEATSVYSKYKGVTFFLRNGRWSASITRSGKRHFLGYHDTEESAALAYNKAARELDGKITFQNAI